MAPGVSKLQNEVSLVTDYAIVKWKENEQHAIKNQNVRLYEYLYSTPRLQVIHNHNRVVEDQRSKNYAACSMLRCTLLQCGRNASDLE